MTASAHLWAIGFDDMEGAEQARDEIAKLGWDEYYLCLLDLAVVVRNAEGMFTVERQPFPAVANILGCTTVGLLAGLVLAAPLTGAIVGAALGKLTSSFDRTPALEENWSRESGESPGDCPRRRTEPPNPGMRWSDLHG
jgi:uncharacterized membrane protein